MSIRLNTLAVAIAAVLSPLAVQAHGHDGFQQIGDTLIRVEQPGPSKTRAEVRAELAASQRASAGHDGFELIGDTLVRVAQPAAQGKTRAQVQAELAAWRADPRSHDGFAEIGGESLYYVGKPMSSDVKLADRKLNLR